MSATERSARRFRIGITLKIFAASTALVAVAVLGGLGIASARASRTAEEAIDRQLAASHEAVQAQLRARTATAIGMLRVITLVPAFRELLTRPETPRATLFEQSEEHATSLGASFVMIVGREGVLEARSDDPYRYGDSLRGVASWVDDGLDQARVSTGVMISGDSLFQLAAVPIVEPASGVVHGVIAAAFSITDSVAAQIKRTTGSEIVFWELFVPEAADAGAETDPAAAPDSIPPADADPGTRADSAASPGTNAVPWQAAVRAATFAAPPALVRALADTDLVARLDTASGPVRLDATIDGSHYVGVATPLRATHGEVYGGVAALRSRDAELAAFTSLQRALLGSALAGIALSLVGSAAVARRIAGPVRKLAAATERVQEGEYDVEVGEYGSDEIGTLARSFGAMLEDLREKQALVDYLMSATGGATVRVAGAVSTAAREAARAVGRVLEAGEVLAGRYEIRSMLGMGGMGVVYLARDRELDEAVAIKTLRPEAMGADTALLERFKQEIRLARRITHRNVVRTHDLGEVDGLYYITMEYVEGTTLQELIKKRGRLPVGVMLTVGKQLCRALEAAHEQGVIHRDIKPHNIVIEANGFLKVMDFGIARVAERSRPGEGLTAAGMSIGTPEYMAPEQLMAEEIDARADLYAAGAVLYECGTGRTPYVAKSYMALMAKHLEETPADPSALNPEIPAALAGIILKALARRAADRWQSASALHDALERVTPVAA